MIAYFTKRYQAVPALMPLHEALGGEFVTTRPSTRRALRRVYSDAPVTLLRESLGRWSRGDALLRRADAIVTGSPNRALLSRYAAKKYMVFHGTYALLSQADIEAMRHFDHICVIGPRMVELLAASDVQEKLIPSGYLPFLDFPFPVFSGASQDSRCLIVSGSIEATTILTLRVFYNRKQRHSTLDYRLPTQFLKDWINVQYDEKLVA